MPRRLAELVLFAAVLTAGAAQARESDRTQPMNVEADDIDLTMEDTSETVLTGNVKITQGTLRIDAGKATVSRKDGDIVRALLTGAPARMQQENDEGVPMKASAANIDYDVGGEVVVLTGDVAVDQGADTLRGQRITYDLKNGRLNASGAGAGSDGRIRMTIQPRPKPEAAAKPEGTPP